MSDQERRAYVRAPSRLRVTMERLDDPTERAVAIAEILAEPVDAAPAAQDTEIDPSQLRLLQAISAMMDSIEEMGGKLDLLLDRLDAESSLETGDGDRPAPAVRKPLFRLPLHDLSGGGFSFLTHDPPEGGAVFRAAIDVSRFPLVSARCVAEAKWILPLKEPVDSQTPGAPMATHEVGVEIQHIRDADRELLIRSVFKVQREALRARKRSSR